MAYVFRRVRSGCRCVIDSACAVWCRWWTSKSSFDRSKEKIGRFVCCAIYLGGWVTWLPPLTGTLNRTPSRQWQIDTESPFCRTLRHDAFPCLFLSRDAFNLCFLRHGVFLFWFLGHDASPSDSLGPISRQRCSGDNGQRHPLFSYHRTTPNKSCSRLG